MADNYSKIEYIGDDPFQKPADFSGMTIRFPAKTLYENFGLLPCIRNSDGQQGLYDPEENRFFTVTP